jgi:DNA-binding NtrC family response regulator
LVAYYLRSFVKSILVLEDEPGVMTVFRLVLQRAGYTITEARCAEQAIGCAELNPSFSLVIADVMPPCSGISVGNKIRGSIPSLRVILTSGYPTFMWSDHDIALYRSLPADVVRILPKPFICSDVLSIVGDLIGPSLKGSARPTVN